ncbi:MAG: riboflavin synthase [Rhodospirillales bacterium]|jgi:riboflavin synthase
MFTGLVSDVGRVEKITRDEAGARIFVATVYDTSTVELGASIALSGACHTVTEIAPNKLAFFSSNETLARTTLGSWTEGTRINLERSLTLGQELGGHIVSGHVDGVGEVQDIRQDGDAWRIFFLAPKPLLRFIAEKGSIAVDGVSLTVNGADNDSFHVAIIPHTMEHTAFGDFKVGSRVNLEIDMLARYVKRLLETEDLT